MELSSLAGNSRLKEQLSQREEGRGLSHAYLISGPAGSGRHTLARLLAAAMVCSAPAGMRPCGTCPPCKKVFAAIHPDVITVTGAGEGKPIQVDQIRTLRTDAHIRPNEGERKVYLLEGADRMNPSAQNAMLKLLEEGPKYAAFLLLCENSGGMLQTVRSRCEELTLSPVSVPECEGWLCSRFPGKDRESIHKAALDCQGLLGRAVELLEGGGEEGSARRANAKALADALEQGSELEVFEASMALEKQTKEELPRLLAALEGELIGRMAGSGDRRRLYRAVELTRKMKEAAFFNANAGQIAGWLCAGLFSSE